MLHGLTQEQEDCCWLSSVGELLGHVTFMSMRDRRSCRCTGGSSGAAGH